VSHTLASGTKLGPYEISELIGRGGMGEVYRAKDGRLGRQVAIKILPKSFAADQDRLKRFEREARSAGQLNHPNVVAIYDIGTTDNTPYIVSELLDGQDLRTRLNKGGAFPPRKAIAAAIQVAKGLAAAHAKGIAHRDLKPENLMVLSDDHVKIVDFGLAKLNSDEATPDSDDTSALASQLTAAGTVIGTASYMAPEQIRQQPTDQRADIFAVGAILHEMLTGKRAFDGATPADRIASILNTNPPELAAEIQDAAPGVSMLIDRCLEKSVEGRFQSAHDLVIALQMIEVAAGARRPAATTQGATQATATATARHTFRRVTFREGHILTARFAPDGQSICYGSAWEGRPVEMFWAYPGNPESRALGYPETDILSISPSGEMAVALRRHTPGGFVYTGMLARMPAGGGAPREILDGVQEADWSPDGTQLAIIRETGGYSQIEYPVGKVLYKTAAWLSHLRISRDGKRAAFLYHPTRGDDGGGPAVVDLNGEVRMFSTDWSSTRGLAWSPDGSQILFTAFRVGVGRGLHRVTLDGVESAMLDVPGHLTLQDVSRQGVVLVVLEDERMRMAFEKGNERPRDFSWLDWTLVRAISPDGRKILFDETAVGGGPLHSVYLRDADGSPAIRLGDGDGLDLSPDGQWALAGIPGSHRHLVLLPVGAGESRKIKPEVRTVMTARFFPDGRSLSIIGHDEGKGARLYRMDPATGKCEPFSDEGISFHETHVSPDGQFVAASDPDRNIALYPVSGGTPRVIAGLGARERAMGFNTDGTGLHVIVRGEIPGKVQRVDVMTGERTLLRELSPADPTGVEGISNVRTTPAGDAFAYSYVQRLTALYVVEGLF
jgi:tRNA A-37 threonylcarbamoyl transferase component Bud32/dipeptidyl aminopeptidase/acylaminoacyl peptidase